MTGEEGETLLDHAFAGSPIGLAVESLDGRYLRVNGALAAMLGRDPQALVGASFADFTHPDDRERDHGRLAALLAGEIEAWQGCKRYATAGEWRTALVSASVIRDGEGRPAALFVQAQDIDERVTVELARGRLAAIVESSRDAIFAVTLAGVITAWNGGAEAIFGLSAEEAIGADVAVLALAGLPSEEHVILEQTRRGRPVGPYEMRRRRRDGTEIDVSLTASPIRDEHETVIGASVIARDITSHKLGESRLHERERYFRAVFDSSQDAMLIADDDRRYVDANPAACALTGYTRAELCARRVEDLGSPGAATWVAEAWTQFLRAGVATGSMQVHRPDGDSRDVEYAATANIVPGRHLSILRDVTERLRAEAAHRELEAQLQQARRMESVGQLAGGIAHDFNNLLSVILNYSHFVAARVREEDLLQDVGEIAAAAERAAALTRQLLIVSRREAIHPEPLDLREVVSATARVLGRTLGERIRVTTQLGREPAMVFADRGQLDRVLMNLGVNARDAMPAGGELQLVVESDATRGGAAEDARVRLRVLDTGSGMTENVRAHAFEPFFTTKPKGGGTGLGLATVYGIITQAQGTVKLHSIPGAGTTVLIELPAHRPASPGAGDQNRGAADGAANSSDGSDDVPAAPAGARVLVVEDEREVRELTRRILDGHGYRVDTASGGMRALRACRERPPDLVLSDVVMAGMDGPELAERLRAEHGALPIVFMSGYSERGRELAARERLLEKPFTAPQLLRFVAEALGAALVDR